MATITKGGSPMAVQGPQVNSLSGLISGEVLAAGDACYIKSDGKVWLATGTAANAAAKVFGYACQQVNANEAITLFWNLRWRYGAGLTPGTAIYLSATPGALSDVATTGGTAPIGVVVDANVVYVWQARY